MTESGRPPRFPLRPPHTLPTSTGNSHPFVSWNQVNAERALSWTVQLQPKPFCQATASDLPSSFPNLLSFSLFTSQSPGFWRHRTRASESPTDDQKQNVKRWDSKVMEKETTCFLYYVGGLLQGSGGSQGTNISWLS